MFGKVEYGRRIYQTIRDYGSVEYVYLLDEELGIPGSRAKKYLYAAWHIFEYGPFRRTVP